MSNINIKNFVDINIIRHLSSTNVGTRDTVVLFSSEKYDDTLISSTDPDHPLNSLADAKTACGYQSDTTVNYDATYSYLKTYFDNGGVKAIIIAIDKNPSTGTFSENLSAAIDELDNKYICITYVSENTGTDYNTLIGIAKDRNNRTDPSSSSYVPVYGVNQKLIITSILTDSSAVENAEVGVKNFIVKCSNSQAGWGDEMTIPAYLSRIDVYKSDTVHDYMFTIEKLYKYSDGKEITNINIDNDLYNDIIEKNMNVDITLADKVRNCGGNCSDGDDIVNCFVRIILQQTVTQVVLQTLVEKLKNQSGLNKIYSTIANELENYKKCGYLTNDKIWEDEDLFLNYNGQNYLIIEKGTAIQNGYYIKILPFASLEGSDKLERKTPPIYLIIAEQYGIRKITINGEAI